MEEALCKYYRYGIALLSLSLHSKKSKHMIVATKGSIQHFVDGLPSNLCCSGYLIGAFQRTLRIHGCMKTTIYEVT